MLRSSPVATGINAHNSMASSSPCPCLFNHSSQGTQRFAPGLHDLHPFISAPSPMHRCHPPPPSISHRSCLAHPVSSLTPSRCPFHVFHQQFPTHGPKRWMCRRLALAGRFGELVGDSNDHRNDDGDARSPSPFACRLPQPGGKVKQSSGFRFRCRPRLRLSMRRMHRRSPDASSMQR
jgi:hypothetical protein